jgi:hypothetical protein
LVICYGVGRKHVINSPELVLKAVSGQDDVFKSKAGGSIACNEKVLVRLLVSLGNSWRHYGDVLDIVRFEDSKKTAEKWTTDFSGKKIKTIKVYWEL